MKASGFILFLAWGLGPAAAEIAGPLVTADRWPQCTDLKTWTRDVMRIEGLETGSETARGKAFFEWLRLFNRMATGGMIQAYEGEYGNEKYVLDLHKNLFVYGWGFCDTHSRIAEGAWQEYTGDPRSAERVITQHDNGGYHTLYRLRLDGRYGAFDPRYGYYLIDRDAPDARVLDWIEVGEDANILANRSYKHRSRPFFEFFGVEWERALALNPCYFEDEPAWEKAGKPIECAFGNGQYEMGTRYHDMKFRLPKGMTIERFWDNSARMFYIPAGKHTRKEEPFLPSGRFYRVTETMFDCNWPKFDPNHKRAKPYLASVPPNEGYNPAVSGGRTIGQACGRLSYAPDLADAASSDVLAPGATLVHSSSAPFLRPAALSGGGEAALDFYSPYVLVDGQVEAELAGTPGSVKLELRVLQAKPRRASDPDIWSPWQTLHASPGPFRTGLGRDRFNGADASIHGAYRFQLRVAVAPDPARSEPAGLKALKVTAAFENGIMSIPQIFAGANTVRFKLNDARSVRSPIRVTYRYQTAAGEKAHEQGLRPADFRNNEAVYQLDAPGLLRCNSLAIAY
ncbi:MAG: hypothetical protein KIT09_31390 [Bryobacteraceae bacterium]|nr:hypothetical protein [Bryobacteraceae bacterium]